MQARVGAQLLQQDLDWLLAWSVENALPINTGKCTVLGRNINSGACQVNDLEVLVQNTLITSRQSEKVAVDDMRKL